MICVKGKFFKINFANNYLRFECDDNTSIEIIVIFWLKKESFLFLNFLNKNNQKWNVYENKLLFKIKHLSNFSIIFLLFFFYFLLLQWNLFHIKFIFIIILVWWQFIYYCESVQKTCCSMVVLFKRKKKLIVCFSQK